MALAADTTEAAAKALYYDEQDTYGFVYGYEPNSDWDSGPTHVKDSYRERVRQPLAAALDTLALHDETRRYGCYPMDLEALAEELRREVSR